MKKTLGLIPFFLLIVAGCLWGNNEGKIYNYSFLKAKDGLSQNSVLKILQDSKGFIWFATRNGLNRYDGTKFTVYRHHFNSSSSLSDNHITALAEDHDGNLWIGTVHGLNRMDLRTGKITSDFSAQTDALSNSIIQDLCCDAQGRVFVGTQQGLYLYEDGRFRSLDLDGRLKGVSVCVVCATHDGQLLVGTMGQGLYVCSLDLKLSGHYAASKGNLHIDRVPVVYEDSRNRVWIGNSWDGIARMDLSTGKYTVYKKSNSGLHSNSVRCFADDGQKLYIGTSDGICSMPLGEDNAEITAERNNLSHFSVYSILIDNCGTRWVGTYSGGVNYYNKYNNRFTLHSLSVTDKQVFTTYGIMDYDAKSKRLYIATEGSGLLEYDYEKDDYRFYLIDESSKQHSLNIIKTVKVKEGIVWCGTNEGAVFLFDTRTKRFTPYFASASGSIYSILHAADGSIWIATSDETRGVLQVRDGKVVRNKFTQEQTAVSNARNILELRPGVFLIGTRYKGLMEYDERRDLLTTYDSTNGLYNNYITSLLRDKKGNVWVGTFGGGFCRYEPGRGIVEHYTTDDGLISNEICHIVQGEAGFLWISTTNGISRFSPSGKEFANYGFFYGTGIQEFSPHSGTVLGDSSIVFGGNNEFLTFHPSMLGKNRFIPPVVLTKLAVNNQTVYPGEHSLLSKVLDETRTLELDYRQNNIIIGYSGLNYIHAHQNQYAYRLKDYDKEWNYVGNRQEAYYTNLKPGKYLFEVKAANNDGIWNEQPRTLQIIVHPPFWMTWYAYLFYAVSFFGVCFLVMYYIMKKKSLEQTLAYEHLKQQQAEEFHQTKIRMFTNFSHELRTPLTLIISPLQELLQRNEFNTVVKNKLSLIYNNSQRLLLLVNQLMDLRKNQAGKMHLKIAKDDICSFMQEVYTAFNQIALGKGIRFGYECSDERIPAWFDKSLLEKVVFNLLSNAFKYTCAEGNIVLSVGRMRAGEVDGNRGEGLKGVSGETALVHLVVCDTGKGIPAEELENIFTPFYQIEDGESKDAVGTGIGLSLTQSIVQLHHGAIWAENNEQGGASFHVLFPIDRSAYSEEEIDRESADRVVVDVIPSTTDPGSFSLEKKYTVLLAEDNEEVRSYVKSCLEPYFYVLEADNGETAFEKVVDKYPDIVVSDIMMPRKDGLELCAEIKQDLRTGHIPVILMTARSMVMQIKEGFSSGADDYIVKPFNMDVLIYRIKNILVAREKLRNLYGKRFSPESIGVEIVSGNDKFTQEFFGVIEKNIMNPELDIDFLSKEIGMSRSNLYRKLKAITDLSPMELVRNKRLEVATKLLLESDYTISEVATYAGFNSHAYFTNTFRAVYGCSPTEFAERHRK